MEAKNAIGTCKNETRFNAKKVNSNLDNFLIIFKFIALYIAEEAKSIEINENNKPLSAPYLSEDRAEKYKVIL